VRNQLASLIVSCTGLFAPDVLYAETQWSLEPSLKYDALCVLNVLSDDPFYLKYYQAEHDHFAPLLSESERESFHSLKRILKDEAGGIISAQLSLYFSTIDAETLDQMIQLVADSTSMRRALERTPYWNSDSWAAYDRSRPALKVALEALRRLGFAEYWTRAAKPQVDKRIAEIQPQLSRLDVIGAIEPRLGHPLQSRQIRVFLLAYSKPHGIRISGTRFLTHYSYPIEIVVRNAIHEMLHPPYDKNSPSIARALRKLGKDPRIRAAVENHDRSFGYTTVEGYVEEDSVQAIEAVVAEELGVARDQRAYWKEQDGGMHVLAAAIYFQLRRAEQARGAKVPFPEFFAAQVRGGHLTEKELGRTIDAFFSGRD
jgi:hypothetical protein